MKRRTLLMALALVFVARIAFAQDTVDAHVAAARAAAAEDHTALFQRLCAAPEPAAPPQQDGSRAARPQNSPDRALWHADPVKVFDNLYYVGQTAYSAWAVTTSDGIVIIDPIFDYSVEDEIVNGLQTLGFDPETIKYVIVSHGHRDHVGGASYLQDRFGARVVMGAADWDLIERDTGTWAKPRRDMVATDGQKLTLGDTTLTLYSTPGHTLGTISTIIPLQDGGSSHVAALWGGTAFNWLRRRGAYITPDRPDSFWFTSYSSSARRFREVAAELNADVLLSNHPSYDGSSTKLPAMSRRKPGDPHPYVIGNESVQRYLTVAEECAKASLLRTRE